MSFVTALTVFVLAIYVGVEVIIFRGNNRNLSLIHI